MSSPLVAYSTSDSDDDSDDKDSDERNHNGNIETRKRPRDDGESASGDKRQRTFEHESGKWATSLLLPCSLDERLGELVQDLVKAIAGHASLALQLHPHFHMSLSRTFPIEYCQVDALRKALARRLLADRNALPIQTRLATPVALVNDERTRTFLAFPVAEPAHGDVVRLIRTLVDPTLVRFSLPVYYKEPLVHVSVASVVGDERDRLNALLRPSALCPLDDDLWQQLRTALVRQREQVSRVVVIRAGHLQVDVRP